LRSASPPYFDKGALTDKTERFFVSEIVREQILLNYKKEVPYSVEVDVEEFKEADDIIRIRTVIYVATRYTEGNHHRTQGIETQASRDRRTKAIRVLLCQASTFRDLCQSQKELARQRPAPEEVWV
jgi:hypothetical protein